MTVNGLFEVGRCRVERDLDRISCGSERATIRPQVMDVLVYLADHAGQIVSSEELLDSLWPGKVVTSASIYNCIAELRSAFQSLDSEQSYVETVPKRGYRLVAPVVGIATSSVPDDQKRFPAMSKALLASFVIIASAAVILILAREEWSASAPQEQSIAVLPFVNMSPDPDHEYFADGLAEELLNSLAVIGELRVISRASSFAFKDRNASVAEIAAALRVDHILDGSVRRAGDTVRITAQLIKTSSDSHIWSGTYDRELDVNNILDIQAEIAARVVDALNLRLRPRDLAMLVSEGPANLRALDLFHDGMFYLDKIENGQSVSRATFDTATRKFEEAIAADPNWAPPHAALGRTYHFRLGNVDDPDPAEALRRSTKYITEAIELDEDYGPAYGSLGYILATSGDYDGAMRAFDRARALNADKHWGRAILLMGLGRHEEAIDEYRKAADRHPLSTSIVSQLAGAYLCAGRFADAIDTIESDDGIFVDEYVIADRKFLLSESYLRTGDKDRGLQIAFDIAEETGDSLFVAYLFALAGEIERARAILSTREVTGTDAFLEAAWVWAVLDDEDRTLTMLERAAASAWSESQPLWVLENMHCAPEFQRYSGNPRFAELFVQLGMPD